MDVYEDVKRPITKSWTPGVPLERTERSKVFEKVRGENKPADNKLNWRDRADYKDPSKISKHGRSPLCFVCSSPNHLRFNCPDVKRKENNVDSVNKLENIAKFDLSFTPYLSNALVNGKESTILRDSGTCVDLLLGSYLFLIN